MVGVARWRSQPPSAPNATPSTVVSTTRMIAGIGQVGLGLGAVDLVRDQDRGAEQDAGEEPALGTRGGAVVVEAGADAAEHTEDREHQVGALGDAEEVAGDGAVGDREDDREQQLERTGLLGEQRGQLHGVRILTDPRHNR